MTPTQSQGKTIFDNPLICALLLLIFVKPAYLGEFEWLDKPFVWMTFFATGFVIIAAIFTGRLLSYAFWWTFAFFGIVFISTFLNNGELYKYCRSEFNILGACIMFDVWLRKSPGTLLSASRILQIYIYINFITVLLYPEGMPLHKEQMYQANWFLGYKNPQIRTILPIVSLSILHSYWKYKRMSFFTLVLVAICMITFLLIDSATALVGFVIFVALLVLFNNGKIPYPKMLNINTAMIAVLILGVAIIFYSIQNNFEDFFHNVLDRETDFTNRLTIWYDSVYRITEQPIIGYGYMIAEDFVRWYRFEAATHPHNFYLYILIRGGFVLAFVVLMGLVHSNKILMRYIDYSFARIIIFTLISFMVMGLSEALVSTVLLYPMFILGINSDALSKLDFRCFNNSTPSPRDSELAQALP